jgi:hypothetical protein
MSRGKIRYPREIGLVSKIQDVQLVRHTPILYHFPGFPRQGGVQPFPPTRDKQNRRFLIQIAVNHTSMDVEFDVWGKRLRRQKVEE